MDSQFLIYQNQEGDVKIDVRFQDETIWLSLDQMAIKKSAQEYEKYQTKQRQIERENSLKELEDDLKQLTN
ncbi:hypothetical protein [Capnocytophaga genosp. AHN8471]|uniref:hypothetical protein n=1 Tax=Capnocytophaga genosp. AHN8471 TaxID=327574 RepID=UPI001EE42D1C|nr:hypothetical protein [Capnocytophaga genosp. AHN8471]